MKIQCTCPATIESKDPAINEVVNVTCIGCGEEFAAFRRLNGTLFAAMLPRTAVVAGNAVCQTTFETPENGEFEDSGLHLPEYWRTSRGLLELMRSAISREDYEAAAFYRDELNKIL